jgi:hypothetical protein
MAHFAKVLDGVVQQVIVADEDFFKSFVDYSPGKWIQTSYNTKGGVHLGGGVPLRKNFAGVGYIYDAAKDAFIPPKPYPSWILNEQTCLWDAPIEYPKDGKTYKWVESTGWQEVKP